MLKGKGTDSQIINRQPHHSRLKEIKALGLPLEIKVRFVRVTLVTGEYEVLGTKLIDEEIWPTTEFKEIYWLRWGVEDFYRILNTRLKRKN